jgi:hypothetical protein
MESSGASQPTSPRPRTGHARWHQRGTRRPSISLAYGRFGTSTVDRMHCEPSASPSPLCVASTQTERVELATQRTPMRRACARYSSHAPAGHPAVANRPAIISSSSITCLLLHKTRDAAFIHVFPTAWHHSRREAQLSTRTIIALRRASALPPPDSRPRTIFATSYHPR